MLRHPAKHELMAYAESRVDTSAPISAKVAGHVAGCKSCLAEAAAMRASLEFAARAADLDPSPTCTTALLLAAQKERHALRKVQNRRRSLAALGKATAYAAGIAVVASVCFGAALKNEAPRAPVASSPPARVAIPGPSPEAIRKAAAEVRTLSVAVSYPSSKPLTLRERAHQRRALALKADIAEAMAALEQNPGCTRASLLIETGIQRQAQTLRALYVERTL